MLWTSGAFRNYQIGEMADYIRNYMINNPERHGHAMPCHAMPELTAAVVE